MQKSRLRSKFILAFLLVSMVPLLLATGFSSWALYSILLENARQALYRDASMLSGKIDDFIAGMLDDARRDAMLPDLVEFASASPAERGKEQTLRKVYATLNVLKRDAHLDISSYSLLDETGKVIRDSTGLSVQDEAAMEPFVSLAASSGRPIITPVLFPKKPAPPFLCILCPLRNIQGKLSGLLVTRFHVSVIQRHVFEHALDSGPTPNALLLDENDTCLANNYDKDLLFQPALPLTTDEMLRLKSLQRLPAAISSREGIPGAELKEGLASLSRNPFFQANVLPRKPERMHCIAVQLKRMPWTLVMAVGNENFLAAVRQQVLLSLLLAGTIGLVAVVAAFFLSRVLSDPMVRLTGMAREIAKGNLDQTVSTTATDEIGDLTSSFNQMAEALRQSREEILENSTRLQILLDTIPDSVFVHTPEGRILDVNDCFTRMYGYSRKEAETLNVADLSGSGFSQEKAENLIGQTVVQDEMDFEWVARHKSGREFPVFVRLRKTPLGEKLFVIAVVSDMTERKAAEKEKKKFIEETLTRQKLEAIGILAGGIAHDFNNILTAILGNVSLSRYLLENGSPVEDNLREVEKATLRARELTQQLLTFSKGGAPVKKAASLEHLVKDSVKFILSGSNVRAVFDFPEDMPPVNVDTGQINQVINNLTINAVQAMPSGGTFHISARLRDVPLGENVYLKPGRHVATTFTDEGTGIPEDILTKIFDPFFTTKEKGSGLGLAGAFSILRKHEGAITVESKPGQGASFTVYLPVAPVSRAVETEEEQLSLSPSRGRMLLMDDEPMVLTVGRDVLRILGYDVLCVEDGETAVEAYRQALAEDRPFLAAIMDLTVPGRMGGREAGQRIRELDPSARLIVSSGYSNDPVMAEYRAFGFDAVVAKPYLVKELEATLKSILPPCPEAGTTIPSPKV